MKKKTIKAWAIINKNGKIVVDYIFDRYSIYKYKPRLCECEEKVIKIKITYDI